MMWKSSDLYGRDTVGHVEGRGGFLFLPKRIGNEWRWLERAEWEVEATWVGHVVWVPVKWTKMK